MKKREDTNEAARDARVREITERISTAAGAGLFDIEAEMDYIQSDLIEISLGYTIEMIGNGKRQGCKRYKISWN